MTWNDLVREYLPDVPEDFAGYVLWNLTCFPFGTEAQVRKQLAECAEVGVEEYQRRVNAEMDQAMADLRSRENQEVEAWRIVDERARELWTA